VSHQSASSASADAASRLRAAFARKPVDPCLLKDAVCAFADGMKKTGASVERTIVEIKRIAEAEMGPIEFSGKRRLLMNDPNDVVVRAVTWSIECYYEPEARAGERAS
jgi:hypothetical protein